MHHAASALHSEGSVAVQPVGRYLLRDSQKNGAHSSNDGNGVSGARNSTLDKLRESSWKCVASIALTVASGIALKDETYWRHTESFWTECSQLPCEFAMPPAMRFAYALDMAYYTCARPLPRMAQLWTRSLRTVPSYLTLRICCSACCVF
jgi:hypothetical protein